MINTAWLREALDEVLVDCPLDDSVEFTGVSTDTRTVRPGDLFFAIAGDRFDGHDYLDAALEMGAAAAVVSRPVGDVDIPQILVTETRMAYGIGAHAWRERFRIPVAAVVGSNGKTTTTQLLGSVFRAFHGEDAVCVTKGNFNNLMGVPHMLWSLREHHKAAVIEAGMSFPGEMPLLANWISPTAVLITNAQREHQEFLDGVEASARENGFMIVGTRTDPGLVVYPQDDPGAGVWEYLTLARRVASVTYSTDPAVDADVSGAASTEGVSFANPQNGYRKVYPLHLAGSHNVHNATGVIALALASGIPEEAVEAGLDAFRALPGRGARLRRRDGGLVLIDDAYNANPDSVEASMRMLAAEPGRRTFVFGDMGEVGADCDELHREVGRRARELGIEELWTFGPKARLAAEAFGPEARVFEDRDELGRAVAGHSGTVTLKASHSTGLHLVVSALREQNLFD